MKNASGLFNLTRNLGGAVGLAVINTILNNRDDMHYARLAESVNWANRSALDTLESLSRTYSTHGLPGKDAAVSQLTAIVQQQAWVMSFIDVFWFLTALFVGLALAAVLMNKPENPAAGGGH